jgi:hypothetical protein
VPKDVEEMDLAMAGEAEIFGENFSNAALLTTNPA